MDFRSIKDMSNIDKRQILTIFLLVITSPFWLIGLYFFSAYGITIILKDELGTFLMNN